MQRGPTESRDNEPVEGRSTAHGVCTAAPEDLNWFEMVEEDADLATKVERADGVEDEAANETRTRAQATTNCYVRT